MVARACLPKHASIGWSQYWYFVLVRIRIHDGAITSPIEALERYLRRGGTTIVRAAFEHSYFAHPDSVREKTPYFPNRVRTSREHYPKLNRGAHGTWQGQDVKLGDNSKAQQAWKMYTGCPLKRGSGYSVRHVWGHPWDPNAFTAGWNLCYMPFWAGMLTEQQNPHHKLEEVVRQAAWDLFFRDDPVCAPPDFVTDPGLDLNKTLDGQPILILARRTTRANRRALPYSASGGDTDARIREIKRTTKQSWPNLLKAVLSQQGKPHEPFGTRNVQATAESTLRRVQRETGLDLAALERRLTAMRF